MSHERWIEGRRWKQGMGNIEPAIPAVMEVTLAAGTAGTPTTVEHNLGRIPNSMSIVNIYYDSGATPVAGSWYREDGDDEWDERKLTARFWMDECSLLVEVT